MKIVGVLALIGKEYQVSDEGLSIKEIQKENPQLSADEVAQVYKLTRVTEKENYEQKYSTEA